MISLAALIVAFGGAGKSEAQEPARPPLPLPAELNVPTPSKSTAPPTPATPAPAVPATPITTAYPSLALMAQGGESSTPLTQNVWLFTGARFDQPIPTAPAPPAVETPQALPSMPPGDSSSSATSAVEVFYSDADATGPLWSGAKRYVPLPGGLLWEPPLANQREPRMYAKFNNARSESTIDTAIGGAFAIGRIAPDGRTNEGIELDAMAAVFTRFNERRLLTAADYRVGMYAAYAKDDWSAKLGYEHTSSHLGDEYIHATGAVQVAHVRDEIVFGLARRFFNQVRVYGEAGYSFSTSDDMVDDRDRYMLGVEWTKDETTGLRGQPFAALDIDTRSDQNYRGNVTFQIGWQWKEFPSRQSARIALELYSGRSPFGQFYLENEKWAGLSMLLDW